MKKCTECDGEHYAKSLCRSHYYKARYPALYAATRELQLVRRKQQYDKNRDAVLQKNKEWRQRNPDKMQEYRDKWDAANPEKKAASSRAGAARWAKENAADVRAHNSKRRAVKKRALPAWADLEKIATVYQRAKDFGFEVDHVVPLQSNLVCGLHVWENLQLLHRPVNCSKGNRVWPDMPGESACA